jgi:hypothetical protein
MIGFSVTETMFLYNMNSEYYCAICFNKWGGEGYTRHVIDMKFKCPKGKCNSSLSFREFIDEPCCPPVRTEFQDLTKMMNLLEISEKKDKKAKQEMELKKKRFEDATLIFGEKDAKRREIRKELAASFETAGAILSIFDSKFKYCKIGIDDKLIMNFRNIREIQI